jgi:thymidylate synthase (FAD)
MTIEVECPLFVATQILRHRSFTFQQFSQRYAKSDLDFHLQETRLQDKSNRQSSNSTEDAELINEWIERQIVLYHAIERDYEWAIKKGIAKECARVILPQSVMTKLYVSGNVRSWIHYLQSRCDPSTQKEHREVAELCKGIFISQLPIVSEAMKYNKETQ